MKYKHASYILMSILFFGNRSFAQMNELFDSTIKPQLISKQFKFTEGPAADKQGNVFFTDQPNNTILKYDVAGNITLFLDKAGRSNGMYFDPAGNLVTCADEANQIWSIDPGGKVTILVYDFKGHRLNGPNDLWIDQDGGIYFTDPYYQRDYWTRTKPDSALKGEHLYYLPAGKKEAVIVDSTLKKPNGIVGSSDGKFLYVSDIGQSTIYRYDTKNGQLSNRQIFVKDLADGMTIDEHGNIYLAGNGITIYNPAGKKMGHINIPEKWTANLCFGGKDNNILFITASEAVYTITMKFRGAVAVSYSLPK